MNPVHSLHSVSLSYKINKLFIAAVKHQNVLVYLTAAINNLSCNSLNTTGCPV